MGKIKSILSSTLFISTALVMTMDLCCEFPKIPNLLAHFSEHQSKDNNSYWELILEHYAHQGSGQNHHDEGEHNDLPFHGSHTCHHVPVVFIGSLSYSFDPSTLLDEKENYLYQLSFSSVYLDAPFQPPQQA